MRADSLIITIVMSLSCVVLTASCVQTATPESSDEVARVTGTIVTDIGDIPDVSTGTIPLPETVVAS